MPPTATGSPSAAGVTDRLAPKDRSSRLTLSPTSSPRVATAAVTAMPSETAKTLSSLRRRRRARDSQTIRKIMRNSVEIPGGLGERGGGDVQLVTLDQIVDMNGIASPRLADGGNVNHRATVATDHILAILVITLVPANCAGVQTGAHRAGGVQNGNHPNFHSPHMDDISVKVMVGEQARGNLRFAILDD